jgi:crotonobetainyl-CoA:carnitine CoA-transferase CaiB-like acyl-CoA transferase
LEAALAPTFRNKPRGEWLQILEANDVPAVPLYNVAEVLDDPQVKHLGLTEELEHPQAGKLQFIGGPVRFDHLKRDRSAPPPLLGEQSTAVLRELGYADDTIADLRACGITRTVP